MSESKMAAAAAGQRVNQANPSNNEEIYNFFMFRARLKDFPVCFINKFSFSRKNLFRKKNLDILVNQT